MESCTYLLMWGGSVSGFVCQRAAFRHRFSPSTVRAPGVQAQVFRLQTFLTEPSSLCQAYLGGTREECGMVLGPHRLEEGCKQAQDQWVAAERPSQSQTPGCTLLNVMSVFSPVLPLSRGSI